MHHSVEPDAFETAARHYRTIFISDIHLGTRGCQAERLLDFLKKTESDTLYLVGDIVDGWRLKKNWYWPQPHNDVVQKILRKARKGTQVIYIPGNHDEALRKYYGTHFGGIDVRETDIFKGANGKTYWVLHGDAFDNIFHHAQWLVYLGDNAYNFMIWFNRRFNQLRSLFGFKYWSLSAFLKHKVKNAVQFIGEFEQTVVTEARKRKVDGVICGHIHHATISQIDTIEYMNDGDWVESCTALVEHQNGQWEILSWLDIGDNFLAQPVSPTEAAPAPQNRKLREKISA